MFPFWPSDHSTRIAASLRQQPCGITGKRARRPLNGGSGRLCRGKWWSSQRYLDIFRRLTSPLYIAPLDSASEVPFHLHCDGACRRLFRLALARRRGLSAAPLVSASRIGGRVFLPRPNERGGGHHIFVAPADAS